MNGGFFDHVPPPTPPPGTAGEYVTGIPVPDASVLGNPPIRGPIGLGFRVPMLVISPFSRGGFVSSDTFDHTSPLLFLEKRFGVEVPNLSAWRRATVGDLTSAFNFAGPDPSIPALPGTSPLDVTTVRECAASGSLGSTAGLPATAYPIPNPQQMPRQEPGSGKRPGGVCAAAPTATPAVSSAPLQVPSVSVGPSLSPGGSPSVSVQVNANATATVPNPASSQAPRVTIGASVSGSGSLSATVP
ncbi:MAG TPA: alkaline phosphatase family protein [Chloroflexota bacterium]